MEYKIKLIFIAILASMVLFAGCTSFQNSDIQTTPTSVPADKTQVTAEPTHIVTEPLVVRGEDVYSVKITIDAKETDSNELVVSVHYDSTSSVVSTGVGAELMATIFAYNYKDVPYDFNPESEADVINAGIPYKNMMKVVYPNNKVDAVAELPVESVQGGLNLELPYNYGVVVEKKGTRN